MAFATKNIEKLRKIGRRLVLPTQEMQQILQSQIDFHNIKTIVDFGAGTLFWSEYFAKILSQKAIGGGANNCCRFYL